MKVTDIDLHMAEAQLLRLQAIIDEQADEIARLYGELHRAHLDLTVYRAKPPVDG